MIDFRAEWRDLLPPQVLLKLGVDVIEMLNVGAALPSCRLAESAARRRMMAVVRVKVKDGL